MNILRYAARYARGTVLWAVIFGTIGGGLTAWIVALVGQTLRTAAGTSTQMLTFAALAVAGCVLRFVSSDLMTRFSQRHMLGMSQDLTRRVVDSGLRNVEEVGSARLLATLTEDIALITTTIAAMPIVVANLAVVVACFLYVAYLSWVAFALGAVCVVVAICSYVVVARRGTAVLVKARDDRDAVMDHYHALTDGFSELKLHRPRRLAFLSRTLHAALERIALLNRKGLTLYNIAANYNQFMFFTVVGVIVFGTSRWASVDPATMTSAVLALLYGRGPLEVVVNAVPTMARAEVALKKYEDIMSALPAEHDVYDGVPAFPPCREVELLDVEYKYAGEDGGRFGLGPIDLTFRAGEIVFVTGGNGSGKTTLAKIVAGLYVPTSGQVRLDGELVTSANRDQYRQHISAVFAKFHLFRELLGVERPTIDCEAGDWLARMRLERRVTIRDGRFSDLSLSTGQRKRLALIVAMLENRQICIFDEWAADQDAEYRERFYLHLLPELKARGKMVIVISHDDRYYAYGDRLIKLDQGKIVLDEDLVASSALQAATVM
ncbi:MAG TPA: cyclic peptide export ABC transporter [Vicinamibacterales bacterium]|nr:cyclic peptide export ABC transporter [Vicinamibacterales bacterium]